MNLIDTHCHLDFDDFSHDRLEVLNQADAAGVKSIIVPGVKADTWEQLVKISDQHNLCYALGLHPYFINEHSEADLALLDTSLSKFNPLAVGEIGLDYYHGHDDKNSQLHFFEAQLSIAQNHSLPIIVHARKSHDDILKLIKDVQFTNGGIIHAFNGSIQHAKKFIGLGFKLGFGGMLTYEKSTHLRNLAISLPLECIVTETDAPDMAGAQHHKQRNNPAYIPEVLETLAEIREQSQESIADQVWNNAMSVFGTLDCKIETGP